MKKQTKQKLIYIRYVLPVIMIALAILAAFIPSYRFIAEGELRDTMSLATLVSNAWEESREMLFAKTGQTNGQLLFAKVILTMIIVSAVLYAVALFAAIWSMAVALKLFISDDEEGAERSRTLFITIFPNRIILTVAEGLALFFAMIPYFMPLIYKNTLALNVKLVLTAPDALILLALSLTAIAVISAITARFERRFDADVFKKRKAFEEERSVDGGEEDYKTQFATENDPEYQKMREEQAERIRRMLGKTRRSDDGDGDSDSDKN